MAKGWSFDSLVKALKDGAFLNIGKTKGTVAAGDDSRIVNALDRNKNLSDVDNKYQSLVNIGGFPYKGLLTSKDNLNNLRGKSYGIHTCNTNSVSTPENNYPINTAGSLSIYPTGGDDCVQIYHPFGRPQFYKRQYYALGGGWQKWESFSSNSDNLASIVDPISACINIGGFPVRGGIGGKNLNSIEGTSFGIWYNNYDGNATTGNNYPVNVAGTLQVYQNRANGNRSCTQVYIGWNNPRQFWIRNGYFDNGVMNWTSWESPLFASQNLSDVASTSKALTNLKVYSAIYPVGIVIIFDSSTNPNSTFPGTVWSEIRDGRAVRAATSTGNTGLIGSDSFTLTEANIPKHTHNVTGTISTAGEHDHKGGWNGPGERVEDNEWRDTSGTNNQGQHNRRRTSSAGSHNHSFSGTVSTAYNSDTKAITHMGASRYYKLWKRVG
ncbi:putative tail fiber protein [Proteus phage Myduc]|uniref:Putative tail fiber protein n=1 Tax=Proteus phage Myduc TaxID=2650874 RepID=A0A5J6T7N7_9CAUD|nr:putative tail fiber protein [Proteus phage Myduc]QFG06698.1 putative tail fiber protein [Proteus phage Myduc]